MGQLKFVPQNVTSSEMLEIPFDILLQVLKGNLEVDSENSVFYIVILWILKDIKERSQYIEQLLTKIDYSAMRPEFFLDVVPHVSCFFLLSHTKPPSSCCTRKHWNGRVGAREEY